MRKFLLIAALLSSTAAGAQQQPTASDRVAMQLGALFIQVQQQQDMIASLQADLAKAQARIKEMEEKAAGK